MENKKTKLELIKDIEATGRIFYIVKVNDNCIDAKETLEEAEVVYDKCKANILKAKRITLREEMI